VLKTDSRPGQIRRTMEGSLLRPGSVYFDPLYQHRIDPAVPIDETAAASGELVKEGKVRNYGLSEAGIANIRRVHGVHPVSAPQGESLLRERNLEPEIIPVMPDAWLLNKGSDIVPIPGTSCRKYPEESMAAAAIERDPSPINAFDNALPAGKFSENRYSDWVTATIDCCGLNLFDN